jgi:hypothetical protein
MRPSARTALFLGFLALQPTRAIGATLFAGSFVDLTVDGPDKKVSLNYPRRGANNLCGVDIKSNVIVLNVSVCPRAMMEGLSYQFLQSSIRSIHPRYAMFFQETPRTSQQWSFVLKMGHPLLRLLVKCWVAAKAMFA